jgi:hypothetical protein
MSGTRYFTVVHHDEDQKRVVESALYGHSRIVSHVTNGHYHGWVIATSSEDPTYHADYQRGRMLSFPFGASQPTDSEADAVRDFQRTWG